MSNTEVGQLLSGSEGRDAIHIAIAPVVAGESLVPGDRVTFRDDGDTTIVVKCDPALAVGIADPFLPKALRPGDRFFMFLNPNTITSLRHEWTHPAFKEGFRSTGDMVASENWLRDFCENNDCPPYKTLMSIITGDFVGDDDTSASIDGNYINLYGMDGHASIPEEFWDHAEVVTGRKFHNRPSGFSCSC